MRVRCIRSARWPFGTWSLGTTILVGLLSVPVRGQVISDNFDDGNADGWTPYAPLQAVFGALAPATIGVTDQFDYQIASANPPSLAAGPARAGSLRTDAVFSEFLTQVDLTEWTGFPDQAVGILARVNDHTPVAPGRLEAYAFTYATGSNELLLSRVVDEAHTVVDDAVIPVQLEVGKDYRLVFRGVGGMLTGQIFDLADLGNPLQTVTFDDPQPLAPGVGGLVVFDNTDASAAGAYFDNYFATVPEPGTIGLFALGGLMLLRRARR